MSITDKFTDYSKDQLIIELENLQLEYEELKLSYQNHISEKSFIEESLLDRTDLLYSLNKYSIELGDLEGKKLYQFIADKFRELFNVRAVSFCIYHESEAELEILTTTASAEENSVFVKYLGTKINNFRVKVSDESYGYMMNEVIKTTSSLFELSFGQIPEIACSVIEKLFGIGWFLGVSLVENGKLFGSLVIAGHKGQTELKNDIVALFAQLTSNILRRKQAEEKLLFSENKFKKAFYTSPDSVNINRLSDGMYISVNKGFTRITGYNEDEVVGKTSIELNIWANPADRAKLVKGLREKGEVENLEAPFLMKGGKIVDGIMSAAIIDLNGVPHILNITRDISDRKEAENALRRSETKYRELIELAVDGILIGSNEGTIIGANSYMLRLAGRELNDLLGMHISELFQVESINISPLRFDLLQKGETVTNERNIIRPDKSLVPIEMHTKMMPDGTYQSIYRDISERKKAEKALRESEEWFRKLFEQSTDGIIYISTDGNFATVNNSFAELHGYKIDEIQSINISDLDTPETKAFYPERMTRLLNGENMKFEVEHFHKSGHRIPLEVSACMVTLGSGKYIMASHRDIAERIKVAEQMNLAREKAEASDKLKTTFLNNISHEVRTPLNGILGFAEIMSQNILSEDEIKESLTMLHESSNRLLDCITNYMDISLLTSGNLTVNNKKFSPAQILIKVAERYKPVCSARKLDLHLKLPENASTLILNSDPEIFNKIIIHLLDNAVKFTRKGDITIGLNINDSKLEFFISDTGIGISENAIKNIFDRFVKLDTIPTIQTEGSGLGLSIAKGMVEIIGGEIRLVSEVNVGSTFLFSVPLINYSKQSLSERSEKITFSEKTGSAILIAEDDEINYFYLNALLKRETSAKILYAKNGREAIDIFRANPDITLILMDLKMPVIDGFEATRQIKCINPDVPVIAITAYAMAGDEQKVLSAGCDGYLSKPISKERLLRKIAQFVKV